MTNRIGIAAAVSLSALAIAGVAAPTAGAVGNFSGATSDATTVYFNTTNRLLAEDTDSVQDIYSRSGGVTSLVSAPGVGASGPPGGMSFGGATPDGSKVFFVTAESLVTEDTDTVLDVYQRSGGVTTLISKPGIGSSGGPAIMNFRRVSADGSKVFFETVENLVASDTDGFNDVYERSGGSTTLVSVEGVGSSGSPSTVNLVGITSDGSKAFLTTSENFIAGDTDGLPDIFERSGGTTSWITAPDGGAATIGTPNFGGFSSDGSKVWFTTEDALVSGDGDGNKDDVYERSGGNTTLISGPGTGATPPAGDSSFRGASSDGNKVIFSSDENLAADDTDGLNDIYMRSGGTTTTLLSEAAAGATPPVDDVFYAGNSSDGSVVFWDTNESMAGADTDAGFGDVYKRELGTTTLVSTEGVGASGPFADATDDGISADGSVVFFETDQNMVTEDTDATTDTYQNAGGVTTLVSAPGSGATGPADEPTFDRTSTDGARVIFHTLERLTGQDGDSLPDIYERFSGTTTMLTGEPGPPLGSPPDTSITSGPPASTTDTSVNFSFTGDETPPLTFECRMDGAAFAPCTSPATVSGLGVGAHTFEVRAKDFSLNVDATPASAAFTVVAPPPAVTPTPTPTVKKCKKGQKLKKGKCVKKKRKH
jgi:hypothetical protein